MESLDSKRQRKSIFQSGVPQRPLNIQPVWGIYTLKQWAAADASSTNSYPLWHLWLVIMEPMSLKHCQILIPNLLLICISIIRTWEFQQNNASPSLHYVAVLPLGLLAALLMVWKTCCRLKNLLTESVTHMWQHVLSWEDSRGWDGETGWGTSVPLMSLVMISVCVRPSLVPRSSVCLDLLESNRTTLCPLAIMSLLAWLRAWRSILHTLQCETVAKQTATF